MDKLTQAMNKALKEKTKLAVILDIKGEKMKAYHFLKDNMTANSGNEPKWAIGEERTYEGEIVICRSGYHSSPSWYDCLNYAPGNMACIVEISEPIDQQDDKYVSKTRKLIDCRNAEKVLRTWACDCAERALKRAKVDDERSWNAIKVARLYNEGKATKEELAAARDAAARAAARAVAWDAARDAARAAVRAVAWAAAWDAVRAVAWAVVRDAVRAVAWAAARDAAWDAARDAAMDAEIEWQKQHLNELMGELFNGQR